MTNLLPPDVKKSMAYARRNRTLLSWATATGVGIVGVLIVIAIGLFYINFQITAYARQVDGGRGSLAKQDLEATQARIGEIDSSVKLALQVLSKEILFSELIKGIGGVIPTGASLQNLSISDVDGALDLQVIARDYQTATQVQVNLQDPANKVFKKADIISISCADAVNEDGTINEYPCQVNIRALFASDSPFLFSSDTAKDKP